MSNNKTSVQDLNKKKAEAKQLRDKLYAGIDAGKVAVPSETLSKMVEKVPAIAKIKLPAFLSAAKGWNAKKAREFVDALNLSRKTPLEFVVNEDDFWASVEAWDTREKARKSEKLVDGWFLVPNSSLLLPELREGDSKKKA